MTPADVDKLFDISVTSILSLIYRHEADVKRQILEPEQCMWYYRRGDRRPTFAPRAALHWRVRPKTSYRNDHIPSPSVRIIIFLSDDASSVDDGENPEIYPVAMYFVKHFAANALIDG